jgi:hypothetical protein
MKKLIVFVLLIAGFSTGSKAQEIVMNLGYLENPEFSIFYGGVLATNLDMEFLIGAPDLGDDSNFLYGAKLGYMFYLYKEQGMSLYAGPHVGGYILQRSNLDNNFNYVDENETSLNYGITAGIYFAPVNIAVGYGIDDLFETEYLSFKVGFDFFGYM